MKSTKSRNLIIGCIIIGLLTISIAMYAKDVSAVRHPNLAAAQGLIEKAIERVSMAQKANEFDMNGHAAKAKTLLDQAYSEIKLAAKAANAHK